MLIGIPAPLYWILLATHSISEILNWLLHSGYELIELFIRSGVDILGFFLLQL